MITRGAQNRCCMTRRVSQVDQIQPLRFNGNMSPDKRMQMDVQTAARCARH